MKNRVVVTGIGIISPLGNKEQTWESLMAGKSGVDNISLFETTDYPIKIAAEVKNFQPTEYMDKKEARRMDRFCQFAVAAAKECLEDGKLKITDTNSARIGVFVGSGIGGIGTIQEQAKILFEKGVGRVSPFFVPMLIPDMASGRIAIEVGAKGPNSCTVTACSSGTHSIGDAFRAVSQGYADVMLAGGAEAAICELGISGFIAARTLSSRNDEPTKASRPFDKDRDGFVMGEGACVLMLETLEHALQRQAPIYGEIVGFGSTADAFHITSPAPEGEGAQRAMGEALRDSGIDASDVDYINAHGTSTEYNDRAETQAIKKVFGEKKARQLAISSTKSLTGHMLGAAGAVEAAVCLLGMQNQTVPGTYNYETVDPDCDLDYIPNSSRSLNIKIAMSNSFGFGGHNGVLTFKRWDG